MKLKLKFDFIENLIILSLIMLTGIMQAAPVPVIDVYCDPGFGPESPETNAQALVYIETAAGGYKVTGATCTACTAGTKSSAIGEPSPVSLTSALTGLKFTQTTLNISAGAKFDLGMTVINDSVGIVLSEIGTSSQSAGDTISVYPTTNGVRVGSWEIDIVAADYGDTVYLWQSDYHNLQLHSFVTVFRMSDFSGDTGSFSFDGIEISGNTGYDPNIVATTGALIPVYVPAITNVLPVTAMTFSPGFDENPELDGQTLTSITVDGRTFSSITGLTCVAYTGVDWISGAVNEGTLTSTNAALSGLKFTQMAANPNTVDYAMGSAVSQSDENLRFILGEMSVVGGTPDPVTVVPLSGGVSIGNWKLEIASGDYGPLSPPWKNTALSTHFVGALVSFAITDFTTDEFAIPLAGVDGFRVDYKNLADPIMFGMYEVIPETGTIIFIY